MRRVIGLFTLMACLLVLSGCQQSGPPVQATAADDAHPGGALQPQTYVISPNKDVLCWEK
jgi:predicted small lipoprotein YifL